YTCRIYANPRLVRRPATETTQHVNMVWNYSRKGLLTNSHGNGSVYVGAMHWFSDAASISSTSITASVGGDKGDRRFTVSYQKLVDELYKQQNAFCDSGRNGPCIPWSSAGGLPAKDQVRAWFADVNGAEP